jgi:quercetin dioxygenase-like cupin family protein
MSEVTIYTKDKLRLKPAVPGAMMWAVGLEKSMLTYFEMEANTVFPDHSHEAEQITLVLEGSLTFAYQDKKVKVRAGEVIAIPSNIRHSVMTGDNPCKAVDAWSPIRKEYL